MCVQRQLSLGKSEEAVSPVIGTVLILAIMITITGTMLAWGIPSIQESEAYSIYTSSQNNLLNLDADLDHVILQGEGASRTSTVSFSSGSFVQRSDKDQIRYYYTTVSWSDPKIVGVKNGATMFGMLDNKEVVDDYTVTLTYPDDNGVISSDSIQWTGYTSSDHIVTGFPALVSGVQATYNSTANSTQIGGFFIYGVDALSYQYSSVSGVFKMRMFNGGIISKVPGGSFGFTSQPLIRSISDSDSYDSLTFYQTNHGLTSSMKNVQGGNYIIDTRNQGGKDISLEVYSIRIGFTGDCSSYQVRQYYSQNWNFVPNEYLFTPDQGLILDKHFGKGDAEEDIVYYQTSAFDFRILERTINVDVNLR